MSGYCGFSKSNNAIEAEADGRYPASVIAKMLGVSTEAVKAIVPSYEWHHTSKFFNSTPYYDLSDAKERLAELKAFKIEKIKQDFEHATVIYLEWYGSRRHPRAKEIVLKDVSVTQDGNWFWFADEHGITRRKNRSTRGFGVWDATGKRLN